jgi:hypothetical protein
LSLEFQPRIVSQFDDIAASKRWRRGSLGTGFFASSASGCYANQVKSQVPATTLLFIDIMESGLYVACFHEYNGEACFGHFFDMCFQ